MSKVNEFIESGILELYVLGLASADEKKEVELMCSLSEEVGKEIEIISEALIVVASKNAPVPNATVKPLLMATIDYSERIKNGETPANPPILNERSTINDYAEWLSRNDMVLPEKHDDIFVKLIAHTPSAISAIVWIKYETPVEVHGIEHEKFLIIEGTCNIIIDGKAHNMKVGDYMSIPLHASHVVKVTSDIPCKVILQRVAA